MGENEEMEGGMIATLVLLGILILLLAFLCLMNYFRARSQRLKHWDDPENDIRWNPKKYPPTSPKLVREPNYNRLSNSSLDKMTTEEIISMGMSRMGSRVGSRVNLNREASFRNLSGLPRDPDQVEIKIPPSFADFLNQGLSNLGTEEANGTPPPYSSTKTADTEQLINDKDQQESSPPELATQARKCIKKRKQRSVPNVPPSPPVQSPTSQEQIGTVSDGQRKTPTSSCQAPVTCVLPRLDDQVELKLPPSYDDLFSEGTEKTSGTPPPYSATDPADTEELTNDKDQQESSTTVLGKQAKKFIKKPHQTVPTVPPSAPAQSPTTKEQKKTPASSTLVSSSPASQQRNTPVVASKQAPVRTTTQTLTKTDTIPSAPVKTSKNKTLPASSQPPADPPKKTYSKVIKKATPVAAQGQQNSSQPATAPVVPEPAPVVVIKKSYKKIKKTVPSEENVKSD
eukprot:GFUD01011076.1.p1 GENE.GFUD01011076.1~~GFUD01011076.1.p1  ORF type:complete len:456 (+),score=148.83 GFUD01011076.1:124-1491(+)